MKYYLTYKDDKSDKFWNIEVSGKSFTVTYGKTGTAGNPQTKTFNTEEKCLKEAEKLLSEKLKKGYVENTTTSRKNESKNSNTDYFNEWEAIVNAKDIHKALMNHFSYLADSSGFEKFPEIFFKEAKSALCTKEQLAIKFKSGEILKAYPPETKVPAKYPESYRKLLSTHRLLELEKAQLKLGEHGQFEVEWLEEIDSELLEITDAKNVICPLWDYSDCWLYHPKTKNQLGEPSIHFLNHEGGDIEDAIQYNVGALFLKRCCESMEIKFTVTELKKSESSNKKISVKWENEKFLKLTILAAAPIEGTVSALIFYEQDGKACLSTIDLKTGSLLKTTHLKDFKFERFTKYYLQGFETAIYLTDDSTTSKHQYLINITENIKVEKLPRVKKRYFYGNYVIEQTESDSMERNLQTGKNRPTPKFIVYGNGQNFISAFFDEVILYDGDFKQLVKIKHKDIDYGRFANYLSDEKLMTSIANIGYGDCTITVTDCSQKKPNLQKLKASIDVLDSKYLTIGNQIWQICMLTKDKKVSLMQLTIDKQESKIHFYPLENYAKNEEANRLDEMTCFQIVGDRLYIIMKNGTIKNYLINDVSST